MTRKLGFRREQSQEYADWIADLKEKFVINQNSEIIEEPKALKAKGLEKVWKNAVATFVVQEP